MGGGVKARDYCFTLSGTKMFFVETKKPSVDVTRDTHPAYQLRRYSWSANLLLSKDYLGLEGARYIFAQCKKLV